MFTYSGSIEDTLASGEYDQGDYCTVTYDELADLVEQAKLIASELSWCDRCTLGDPHDGSLLKTVEQKTNRPLHPAFGGKSPYSEFLPL